MKTERVSRPIVTLIRPPTISRRFAFSMNGTPPLSLAYLAGSLAAAGVEVQAIDAVGEDLERWSPSYRPGLYANGIGLKEIVERIHSRSVWIGISSLFTHEWPVVRTLIRLLGRRFPGVPILCGGEHATALPEFCLENASELSACVLGEGEETCVEVTQALREGKDLTCVRGLALRAGGKLIRTERRPRIRQVDSIPLPRWDLAPLRRYLDGGYRMGVDRGRSLPVLASRGCPFLCTFCSSLHMWTTRYLVRRPRLVVEEIETFRSEYGIENVDFYDLTAITRKDWVVELCERLIDLGSPVTWQLPTGTRSEVIDAEVARLLFEAGCRNITFAPESGSARILEAIRKRVRLPRMMRSVRSSVQAGLNVKVNIMVGFPGERHVDVLHSMRLIARMALAGVHDLSVFGYAPYPGTDLFTHLAGSGRIRRLDDEYCASILTFSNLFGAVSFNRVMSSVAIEVYRLLGLALFYAVSFAYRPTRLWRVAWNVLRRREESRLESALAYMMRRVRLTRRGRWGSVVVWDHAEGS